MQHAERQPRALADRGGQVLRTLAFHRVQAEAFPQAAPALLQGGAVQPEQPGEELDVLAQRQPGIQADLLPHVADVVAHASRVADDVDAVDADLAGGRLEQADQHADGRALAGAVAAQEREDGPGLDHDVERVDGGEIAESLGEPGGADGGRRHAAAPARPSNVASMSIGNGSAKRTPPDRPNRSRSTAADPGEASRRTSTRALGPMARAPAT